MALHISRPRRRWFERWAWWVVRWLAAAAALYGCLFLLLTVGSMLDVTAGRQAARLRIESIRLEEGEYEVQGTARPGSLLLLQAEPNSRILGVGVSEPTGRFAMWFRSSFALGELRVRVIDPETEEELGIQKVPGSLIPDGSAPLSVDVAYFISDAGQLWIAGRAEPFEPVRILAADGSLLASLPVDSYGFFDVLLPLAAPPQQISAAIGEGESARFSSPVVVGSHAAAGLPLARTLTIDQSGPRVKLSLNVTLPVSHPLFAGASQGFLSARELVEAAFGTLSLPLKGKAIYAVAQGQGTVRMEEEIPGPELPLFQLLPTYSGIGSVPLLSPHDQVAVVFGRHRPEWFGEVPPTELTDLGATWRGPLRSREESMVAFGSALPEDLRRGSHLAERKSPARISESDQEAENEREAERIKQLIRSFDQGAGNPLKQVWRTAILLIPFVGFLIVARRMPFGTPEVRHGLAAAALVLAAWRCWSLLYSLVLAGPASWLTHVVIWPLRLARDFEGLDRVGRSFAQIGTGAFWLLFVSLVALVPLYFDNVLRAAADWQPPVRPRRHWLRRAWTVLKGASGTILLVALLLTVREATRNPESVSDRFEAWTETLDSTIVVGSGVLILGCLLLASFGLRGLLIGLVVLLANLHWVAQSSAITEDFETHYREWADFLERAPAAWLLVLFGLASLPALSGLLGRLLPFTPGERRVRWAAAVCLAAVCLFLPDLPMRWTLVLCGMLLAVGFGWLATRTLSRSPSKRPWWKGPPSWTVAVLALAGAAIGWPFPQPNAELRLSNLERLTGELGQLFPWLLALGVVLLLLDHARRNPGAILPKEVLQLGVYLYAVFVINSSQTWLLIPVPLLVGLALAAGWLFRPSAETSRLARMLPARRRSLRALLDHVLGSVESADLLRSIRKSLTGKLEKAEIEPAEYERKLAVYRQYVEGKAARPAIASRQSLRKLVFAAGYSILPANARAALGTGALLALAPLSIALYRYLPNEKVVHPYPLADLLVFLVGAIASWLLYAFFFGYFFAHLRGDTGLTKGIHLFSLVVLPFAVLHLLNTSTWQEMRPFLLWASQVFLFCSLLGLIAFEYGLLRRKGFAASDLRRVHDLPALSAYASTALAAIIPAILAVVTGRLTDLVSFFLNTILPRVPAP